jgi:hypothetical protein
LGVIRPVTGTHSGNPRVLVDIAREVNGNRPCILCAPGNVTAVELCSRLVERRGQVEDFVA